MTRHVVTIVGARPQFVKAAAVARAIARRSDGLRHSLVHSGQHYDAQMSAVFFEQLGLAAPDMHLGVGSGSHAQQTGEMLKRIDDAFDSLRPDIVLVYGDTNTTLAAALAAAKRHIKTAHVEAGLRSFNRAMPEETNRVVTDHVSDLLFCPSQAAIENLAREGLSERAVAVGDVMYDELLRQLPSARAPAGAPAPHSYVLATIHRAEATASASELGEMLQALRDIAQTGTTVVLPLHPRTANAARELGCSLEGIMVMPPVGYLEMLHLERGARVIVTDSGGVQKEAYWLQVPCVTMRDETEWVETVTAGWNVVAGRTRPAITRAVLGAQRPTSERAGIYGDGRAADKIAELLAVDARVGAANK